jgi:hypothetical protein
MATISPQMKRPLPRDASRSRNKRRCIDGPSDALIAITNGIPNDGNGLAVDAAPSGDDVFAGCLSFSPCPTPDFSASMDAAHSSIASPHPYMLSGLTFNDLNPPGPLLPKCNSASPPPILPPAPIPSGAECSLAILEVESHAIQLKQVKKVQGEKGTGDAYGWRISHHETWWTQQQAQRHEVDTAWVMIPAFPVTATKAALFLEYERTQEKVCARSPVLVAPPNLTNTQKKAGSSTNTIPGSNVGKYSILGTISALENWWVNHHHLHKDCAEAQVSLWSDNRIRALESAARHDEPKQVDSLQTLKASGTSSGTWYHPYIIPLADKIPSRYLHL